jgi:hypothetical protein
MVSENHTIWQPGKFGPFEYQTTDRVRYPENLDIRTLLSSDIEFSRYSISGPDIKHRVKIESIS